MFWYLCCLLPVSYISILDLLVLNYVSYSFFSVLKNVLSQNTSYDYFFSYSLATATEINDWKTLVNGDL